MNRKSDYSKFEVKKCFSDVSRGFARGARAISEQGFYNQLLEERSKAVCREYVMCSRVDESARDTKKLEGPRSSRFLKTRPIFTDSPQSTETFSHTCRSLFQEALSCM